MVQHHKSARRRDLDCVGDLHLPEAYIGHSVTSRWSAFGCLEKHRQHAVAVKDPDLGDKGSR